jgi:hypothetical protein
MSERGDTVIMVGASWRVVVVEGAKWGRGRAWMLQRMVDGAWCDVGATRSREMLVWLIGPAIDADAAAQLAALPPRSDIGGPKAPTGKRARVASVSAPAPATKRRAGAADTARAFLHWREERAGR